MTLPAEFVIRIKTELGEEEGARLCAALDEEPSVSVRLNPRKMQSPRDSWSNVKPVPWCSEGYYLATRPSFTFDPVFHAGAYYVQEASSQFVGSLLRDVEVRGARVLDLCAAPGGKTTLYASLVGDEGLVVANEIDRRRANVLADNVRKWGTGNVAVCSCRPQQISVMEGWFDVVAVDAPCSGEGMFRKDEVAREEWSENNVKMCAARQDEILKEAWRMLRPGGTLLYSTCTFNRLEDEGSLERLIQWAEEELEAAPDIAPDPEWGITQGRIGAFQTFHFYPHRIKGEGFFAAVARKRADAPTIKRLGKGQKSPITAADKVARQELARWVELPDRMTFVGVGDTYYAWFAAQADALKALSERVPVIYSGVAVGQIFKGKLKPDPALAFFAELNRKAVPAVELDDEEVLRYLRRQDIAAAPLTEGMNLVTYKGYALGFAKRISQRVNNLYPDSLRIMKQ